MIIFPHVAALSSGSFGARRDGIAVSMLGARRAGLHPPGNPFCRYAPRTNRTRSGARKLRRVAAFFRLSLSAGEK